MKTNPLLKHGSCVNVSTNGTSAGHISCNFGKKFLLFLHVLQFVKRFLKQDIIIASCELL